MECNNKKRNFLVGLLPEGLLLRNNKSLVSKAVRQSVKHVVGTVKDKDGHRHWS